MTEDTVCISRFIFLSTWRSEDFELRVDLVNDLFCIVFALSKENSMASSMWYDGIDRPVQEILRNGRTASTTILKGQGVVRAETSRNFRWAESLVKVFGFANYCTCKSMSSVANLIAEEDRLQWGSSEKFALARSVSAPLSAQHRI